MGKLPRLAHLLSDVKPSAVTLCGDFLSPSALSSIDNGRGHVAILRSAGITHVCLGNHEADLTLPVMKDRLDELGHRGRVVVVNSNVSGLGRHTKEYDVVESNCGRVKIGLLGLLSDESDMFRDGTFRGLNIENTRDKYARIAEKMNGDVDCIVPMTHQTIGADVELANTILGMQDSTCGLILGGHEHQPILETVSNCSDQSIHIVKTGQDADRVAIIDLNFDPSSHNLQRVDIKFHEFTENDSACPICKIKPLMDLNKELKSKNELPGEDDYMKAVDLIVRFCCKDRWVNIANAFSFDDLDINKDGILSREELRRAIKRVIGDEEPPEGLVQGMMDAIDQNESGDIDEVEFNNILAQVRRET